MTYVSTHAFSVIKDVKILFSKVKLYGSPFINAWSRSNREYVPYRSKKIRGGQKYGYIVYVFKGDINDEKKIGNSYGIRVYNRKAVLRVYNYFRAVIRGNADKNLAIHEIINSSMIYGKKSRLRKYIGNKDYFPTFYECLKETRFSQTN